LPLRATPVFIFKFFNLQGCNARELSAMIQLSIVELASAISLKVSSEFSSLTSQGRGGAGDRLVCADFAS
jgi:hypothetical protein